VGLIRLLNEDAQVRVFYDRREGSIHGLLSVRDRDGHYLLEKAITRSGQASATLSSWRQGLSPCPYGDFNLWLVPNNPGQSAGATGVGEFYPIDNTGDRRTIRAPQNQRLVRREIGLHEENSLPGSRGCIVLVYHFDWLRWSDIAMSQRERLARAGEPPCLPLIVL